MLIGTAGINYWEPNGNVPPLPEQCFSTAIPVLVYDSTRGLTPGVSWVEALAGAAANDLIGLTSWPTYTAANPSFGGRPTLTGTGGAGNGVQSRTPAAATLLVQPLTIVHVAAHNTIVGKYLSAGANGLGTVHFNTGGNRAIFAGSTIADGAALATPAVNWGFFNGAASAYRYRALGAVVSGVGNAGAGSIRGLTMHATNTGASNGNGVITLSILLSGIASVADITLFELWALRRCNVG